MEPRKIAVKLRRDPRETAERHSQANPLTLECTLASGEAVTETMELRAELHAAQTPATTPLAATAAVTMNIGETGPWLLEFSGAQMNQTVLPDASEDFWLVGYATNADDDLFTLAKIALTLTFDNISQTTQPPPDPALFLDLGGTQWKLAEDYLVDDIVALDGSIYVCTNDNTSAATNEPGTGATWENFWTLFSGGGATNLAAVQSPTNVVITSDTGDDATIPAADGTNAGLMLPAEKTKLAGIATGATANSSDATLLSRANHTGTQAIGTITNLQTALNGKADLVGGKLDTAQLPDLAVTQYLGTAANQSAMLLLVGQRGDWCVRSDDGKVYVVTGEPSSTLGNWTSLSYPTAPVLSVAGRTGSVTLSAADIGDSTAVGRALLTALDAAAQRSALGLGALSTLSSVGTSQITDAAVSNAKLAAMAAARIKGSVAGGTPADLTPTEATAVLDLFSSTLKGLVPASGGGTVNFLRADGAFAAPPGGSPAGTGTELQFRSAGAFGAVAGSSWNGTILTLPFTAVSSGGGFEASGARLEFSNGLKLNSTTRIGWSDSSSVDTTQDVQLRRRAAANLQLGPADAAAPAAQSVSVQNVATGTTNTAGALFTFDGSRGTGTGVGGDWRIRLAQTGLTGSAQNTLMEAVRWRAADLATQCAGPVIAGGPVVLATFTVATVPSASLWTRGLIWVSDDTGGATPAFSDGTNWRRVADRAVVSIP